MKKQHIVQIATPIGNMTAKVSERGIHALSFFEEITNSDATEISHPHVENLIKQLGEYFENQRIVFDLPLVLDGTDFQKRVWRLLMEIPYGETRTYREQAQILGDEKAIRAVASANGKNKLAILIPCHRVIGSNGSLTGYAGGIERKKALLKLEGVRIPETIQSTLFG